MSDNEWNAIRCGVEPITGVGTGPEKMDALYARAIYMRCRFQSMRHHLIELATAATKVSLDSASTIRRSMLAMADAEDQFLTANRKEIATLSKELMEIREGTKKSTLPFPYDAETLKHIVYPSDSYNDD